LAEIFISAPQNTKDYIAEHDLTKQDYAAKNLKQISISQNLYKDGNLNNQIAHKNSEVNNS
jgi:hypothetical protein